MTDNVDDDDRGKVPLMLKEEVDTHFLESCIVLFSMKTIFV